MSIGGELFLFLCAALFSSSRNDGEAGQDLLLLIKLIISSPPRRDSPTLKIHYCNVRYKHQSLMLDSTLS